VIVWRTKAQEAIVSYVDGGRQLCEGMEAYTVRYCVGGGQRRKVKNGMLELELELELAREKKRKRREDFVRRCDG
jgi:hypothetical protein